MAEKRTVIVCTSDNKPLTDHDKAEVEKFIDYVKSRRKKSRLAPPEAKQ